MAPCAAPAVRVSGDQGHPGSVLCTGVPLAEHWDPCPGVQVADQPRAHTRREESAPPAWPPRQNTGMCFLPGAADCAEPWTDPFCSSAVLPLTPPGPPGPAGEALRLSAVLLLRIYSYVPNGPLGKGPGAGEGLPDGERGHCAWAVSEEGPVGTTQAGRLLAGTSAPALSEEGAPEGAEQPCSVLSLAARGASRCRREA